MSCLDPKYNWLKQHLIRKERHLAVLFNGKFKNNVMSLTKREILAFIFSVGGELLSFFSIEMKERWEFLIPSIINRQYYPKINEFINFICSDRNYITGESGSTWDVSNFEVLSDKRRIRKSLNHYLEKTVGRQKSQQYLKEIILQDQKLGSKTSLLQDWGFPYVYEYIDRPTNQLLSCCKIGCSQRDQIYFELLWSEKISFMEQKLGQKKFRKLNKDAFIDQMGQDSLLNLIIGRNYRYLFWLSGILYDSRIFHLAPLLLQKDPYFIRLSIVKNPSLMNEIWTDTLMPVGKSLSKEHLLWSLKKNPDIFNSASFPENLKTINLVHNCLARKISSIDRLKQFEYLCQTKRSHLGSSYISIIKNKEYRTNIYQGTLSYLPCEVCSNVKKEFNNTLLYRDLLHVGPNWVNSIPTVNLKCPHCHGSGYSSGSTFLRKIKGTKGTYIRDYFLSLPKLKGISEVLNYRKEGEESLLAFFNIMIISLKMTQADRDRISKIKQSLRANSKISLKLICLYLLGPEYIQAKRRVI